MDDTTRPSEKIRAALQHMETEVLPKGELWLGTELLEAAGFEDDLSGHARLACRLGHHALCLPVAHEPSRSRTLGYTYFPVDAVGEAVEETDLFVMAVIDGPFQRLVERQGLVETLTRWVRQREAFLKAYERERARALDLLRRCLERQVHGIVLADDLAGETGPFLNPKDIERFSSGFYAEAVSEIHASHAAALLHSCGRIERILPHLLSSGFDGLAAVQHRTNDLPSIQSRSGLRPVVMGGIDGDLLEKETLSTADIDAWITSIRALSRNRGFILASSCGLYSGRFLKRVETLYDLADRELRSDS